MRQDKSTNSELRTSGHCEQNPNPTTRVMLRTLEGSRVRCPPSDAEALRRARGPGRLRVDTGRGALGQFNYRHKNCCTDIVMSIAVPNPSELIADTFGIPV